LWACIKINEKKRFDTKDDVIKTDKRKRIEEKNVSNSRNIFKKEGIKLIDNN